MTKRQGTILDSPRTNPELDPGNLCLPMRSPKAEPICYCSPRVAKNMLGGMRPKIDLDAGVIRCATCLKEIGPACRTRAVTHLRGLLMLRDTKPEHFDEADASDAGFLL